MRKRDEAYGDGSLMVRQESHVSDMAVEHLAHLVDDVARDVCFKMGKGLPRSMYVMGLLNHLGQIGLTLESEAPSIEVKDIHHVPREIFVVEGRVMIECILEYGLNSEMEEVYRTRLGLDVKSRSCELGLVINFGRYAGNQESQLH